MRRLLLPEAFFGVRLLVGLGGWLLLFCFCFVLYVPPFFPLCGSWMVVLTG